MSRAPIGGFEATVIAVEDLSPSFRRITFGGPGLSGFGPKTHPRDLRIKLIIPPAGATAPEFDLLGFLAEQEEAGVSWYQAWLQVDPAVRGAMRTYTVREWRDDERELVVDMVMHTDEAGHSGPAAQWAEAAEVGHSLHIIGPARDFDGPYGGIEFAPGDAHQILLAGDETAVPAIASILDSIKDSRARGKAVLEVPSAEDIIDMTAPAGFEIEWLPRGKADFGQLLEPAVREAVRSETRIPAQVGAGAAGGPDGPVGELDDVNIDEEILWDVPAALTEAAQGSSSATEKDDRPFYAWIAGEAGPVKRLRRYLVQEVGVDRKQIAFMGYWRQGKAEG
ncbi:MULTISPECIES: siderophore-interacting protein [unclassified Brevibacterium]|uniref:siderophore-interacting protein n=1 Tax=unclassified Brevibacterium TaxID=2614124 RepID=UPI001091C317|nr:siderophore-interacting protein [Brevibacterium sp. S22]TGD32550.1 siderophore-interacting protein [Brevibacterium sp. S22]